MIKEYALAVLDNAIWFGTDGFAEGGSTTSTEGGNSTTIPAAFSDDALDASAGCTSVSGFGAAFIKLPIGECDEAVINVDLLAELLPIV